MLRMGTRIANYHWPAVKPKLSVTAGRSAQWRDRVAQGLLLPLPHVTILCKSPFLFSLLLVGFLTENR